MVDGRNLFSASHQGRPILIGVAGGSGSGKTTFCHKLVQTLGNRCTIVSADWYYHSLDHLSPEQRAVVNFDHPDSIQFDLLADHLRLLRSGAIANVPQYDFSTHLRLAATSEIVPQPIIVVDGVLVLADRSTRALLDISIFVDASAKVRLDRRIERDQVARGRDEESVRLQWQETVEPMFAQFVAPSQKHADLTVNGERDFSNVIDLLVHGCGRTKIK